MKLVGIFSVPRSGSSWLGQVFNSSPDVRFAFQPMFAQQFRDKICVRSTGDDIVDYFEKIYASQSDFLTQEDQMDKPELIRFPKRNKEQNFFVFKEVMFLYMIPTLLKEIDDMHIIFILRNPLDVLTSWYNAPREFYPEWDIYKEWRFAQSKMNFLPERYYGYEKWEEAVMLAKTMKERYPDRFFIVRYEDLDENPNKYIRELFEFTDIPFLSQTEDFIAETRSCNDNNTYGVHRNKKTSSRDRKELPEEIRNEIKKRLDNFIEYIDWEELKPYESIITPR